MIYDKPRDLNLRVVPSLTSLFMRESNHKKRTGKKETEISYTDNKIHAEATVASKDAAAAVVPKSEKSKSYDNDTSKINNREAAEKKNNPSTSSPIQKEKQSIRMSILPTEVIDISKMPDIEGVPILKLPDLSTQQISELQEAEKARDERIRLSLMPKDEEKPKKSKVPQYISEEREALKEESKEIIAKQHENDFDADIFPKIQPKKVENEESSPPPRSKSQYKNNLYNQAKKQKKQEKDASFKNILSKKGKTKLVKIASFFLMLYVGTIVSFIIPLRPTYSETEKRNLKEFPTFTVKSFASGDYFSDISTWFSDTFPFREQLTKANTKLKSLYGFNTISIHGNVEEGDDIPDIPHTDSSEQETSEEDIPQTTLPPTTEAPTMPSDDELEIGGNPNALRPDFGTQSLGAIIVAGDSAYEYYTFSKDLAPRYINCLSSIKEKANPKGNVYTIIAPTSIDIKLNDGLRSDIKSANQEKALNYFNATIKNVIPCDGVYMTERIHRNEYTYFRTDHHWTALGAYYAYEQFAIEKGIKPIPLNKYETVTFNGFLGTFYSGAGQASKLAENPDFVTAYKPFNNVDCVVKESGGNEYNWDVVHDVNDYGKSLKYLTFIAGDNALTTITNNDNPNGETCIVIKESYGNSLVPFLIPHYSKIYVIDPRHFDGTLADFVVDKAIDDVLFVGNISSTRNDIFISALENLLK